MPLPSATAGWSEPPPWFFYLFFFSLVGALFFGVTGDAIKRARDGAQANTWYTLHAGDNDKLPGTAPLSSVNSKPSTAFLRKSGSE